MKKPLTFIFIICSIISKAQVIDFNNFSEETMNRIMFDEMNRYVKSIHNGDSLIWSTVVQKNIMTDNYDFIKRNSSKPLDKLHNPKWLGRPWNDLPDTIRVKIIDEMTTRYPSSEFLEGNQIENSQRYLPFTYTEILHSITFYGNHAPVKYQDIARRSIQDWNNSPPHAAYMNENYRNRVIIGVATYFDKKTNTIIISFVHVS